LNYDVEVFASWEGCLEEGDDYWEKGAFLDAWVDRLISLGWVVDCFVEDMVEKDFEAMSEVREVGEVAAKGEGGRRAEVC
jgi:hypothetical protein